MIAANLKLILTAVIFIMSAGVWFYERHKDNQKLRIAVGAVAALSTLALIWQISFGFGSISSPTAVPANAVQPVSGDPAAADLSGTWYEGEARYEYRQNGSMISYVGYLRGQRLGWGNGTINGRHLAYRWFNELSGHSGFCNSELSADGQSVLGTCTFRNRAGEARSRMTRGAWRPELVDR